MQKLEQVFYEEMQKYDLRITNNRLAIFRVLVKAGKPLSIQEIVGLTAKESYFTSIYRSVEIMTRVGVLRSVPRGFKSLYELGETFKLHHHHLTCEKCGQSIEIHDKHLERMMHELTIKAGFTPTKHHFELLGMCQGCSKS